jgi:hypothetical protein
MHSFWLRAWDHLRYREPMAATRRRLVIAVAIPLALVVGMLSVGAPGDAWGSPTPSGVTVHESLHADHALAAPRRGAFDTEVQRVVHAVGTHWHLVALAVALLMALLLTSGAAPGLRLDPPWLRPPRRGDPLAVRRGPPTVLPI